MTDEQQFPIEFRGVDKDVATFRARGRLYRNVMVLTGSDSFVEFQLTMDSVRSLFGEIYELGKQLERDGENAPLSHAFDTLDKGRLTLDVEGYLELSGALALAMVEVDISKEDLERYKPTPTPWAHLIPRG